MPRLEARHLEREKLPELKGGSLGHSISRLASSKGRASTEARHSPWSSDAQRRERDANSLSFCAGLRLCGHLPGAPAWMLLHPTVERFKQDRSSKTALRSSCTTAAQHTTDTPRYTRHGTPGTWPRASVPPGFQLPPLHNISKFGLSVPGCPHIEDVEGLQYRECSERWNRNDGEPCPRRS